MKRLLTLLLVHSEHNNDLVASNSDQLLDTSDTSSGEFGQQDHAVNVVVFEKFNVSTHLGDLGRKISAPAQRIQISSNPHLLDIHHDKAVNFRVLLLIEAAVGERHCGRLGGAERVREGFEVGDLRGLLLLLCERSLLWAIRELCWSGSNFTIQRRMTVSFVNLVGWKSYFLLAQAHRPLAPLTLAGQASDSSPAAVYCTDAATKLFSHLPTQHLFSRATLREALVGISCTTRSYMLETTNDRKTDELRISFICFVGPR
jgi:hypothetical protein